MDERNSTISLEMARNGSPVAIVNGIYLHSIYDPEKEAESFVETFESQLTHKTHVLILGLGLGYHVEKVAAFMRSTHKSFHITVLEPNSELITITNEQRNFKASEVSIVHLTDYKKLYLNKSFVTFLMQKPCLIKHEASFGLNKELFAGFLTFKSDRKVSSFEESLSPQTRELLAIDPTLSFRGSAAKVEASGKITSRAEYLTLALREIVIKNEKEL